MDLTISSKKIGNPLLVELLRKLTASFNRMHREFYVIGATARDIILKQVHVIEFKNTSLLTSCINGRGYREPIPIKTELVKKGDKIYLCSDGYYKNVETIGTHSIKEIDDDASMIEIKI